MPSFAAPFYGNIHSLSVDPKDNTIWVVTKHPRDRRIDPICIDTNKLLKTKNVNASVQTHTMDTVTEGVLGHHTGLYVFDTHGVIFRKTSTGFSAAYRCEVGFGLQAIVDFHDGGAQNPKIAWNAEKNSLLSEGLIQQQNNQLLLIGKNSALVVDIANDGTFSVGATFEFTTEGKITAWSAETVFAQDGQTHHCAFGFDSGIVHAYYTKNDELRFQKLGLMDENEVEFSPQQSLHKKSVTALSYVQELDRYGMINRYLVTTGIDLAVFQISLLEGIVIPRKNGHEKVIRGFVKGALSSGDGAYRGVQFGRFYSLSDDGTVKAWLNEYTNEPQSLFKIEKPITVGGILILDVQHSSGIYSKGEFLGKEVPTPHLVVAGEEHIHFIPLIHCEKEHVQLVEDLRNNGRMGENTALDLVGGLSYVQQMGIFHNNAGIRQESLERCTDWDAQWLVDLLRDIAANDEFPFGFRDTAMNALLNCKHPRRIVVLEGMLNQWNNSELSQKMAFEALNILVDRGEFENSLRPHRLVLDNGGNENILRVIGDLASLAHEEGHLKREAKQLLQSNINHSNYDIALRVFDHLSGEGVEPIMNGVEGVLYGIFSNHDALRREMMVRLVERDLVGAFETTLILRRLLESDEASIRERALDVSLLRTESLSNVLRQGDKELHQRLYVLQHGPFASSVSDEEKETILNNALPYSSIEELSKVKKLFLQEAASVQNDIDCLVELSSCSKDDISVYALQAKASFGFVSAAQGLLKLTHARNEMVVRQSAIGLGYLVRLDDAHKRLCGLTLTKETPFKIGAVAISHAIRGFELRDEDPVQNILRKVLDGGNAKLRETAISITQERIAETMLLIASQKNALSQEVTESEKQRHEALEKLEIEMAEAQKMLLLGGENKLQKMIDMANGLIADINDRKAELDKGKPKLGFLLDMLWKERELLKKALKEETLHINVRKEVYRTYYTHNLQDTSLSSDKTATLKWLLNLRDKYLFSQSLQDLCSHIQEFADRDWALALFAKLIDQDVVPVHHSNIWDIWTKVADFAQTKDYEDKVLRIGFECSAKCECRIYDNGSYSVCTRHRIRRDAFLRVLSASGDWLADFILDAIHNKNNKNSNAGESAAILAISERAKKAVSSMSDPAGFVLTLLSDRKETKAQRGFASEILISYPQYYIDSVREKVFGLREDPDILDMLKKQGRLMTAELYAHFMNKIADGHTELLFKTVVQYAMQNKLTESFAKTLVQTQDSRLVRKALEVAVQEYDSWGQECFSGVLDGDDDLAQVAFHMIYQKLCREAARSGSSEEVKSFLIGFYNKSSQARQLWVVNLLNFEIDPPQWTLELLKEFCSHSAEEIRRKGFLKLNAIKKKESWVVELLKKGMMDPDSDISSLCFQGLLAVHKVLGGTEEKEFLSRVARENKKHQEKAIAMALKPSVSWRVQFILEALEDEDEMIRSMMCTKLQSTPGLPDEFFQDLLSHKHIEVQEFAKEVLASRGLWRPNAKSSGSLRETLLENPPPRPWGWFGWISWYWKVQAWKDRKIKAIVTAGKTHDPVYNEVFHTLLQKFGYRCKISELWAHAMYATSWGYDNWWEFIVLHTGWVLKEESAFEYASKEAENQKNKRIRVAWNVACARSGLFFTQGSKELSAKDNLQWLIQQYYDNGWNSHKEFIKREYIFEGLFAVNSTVGFDSNTEGEAFTVMQRLMTDDKSFVNDIFRLNMLRLSHWGGPVDFIGIGYTSADEKTVLESVQMRELQYSKEEIFTGVVALLNDTEIPEKNPYELANLEGNWYDVVRLILELNTKTFDEDAEVETGYWKNIAAMISCEHPQLRARAVLAYFRRHVYGEEKTRFIADIENFSRQLVQTTTNSFPLFQDGKATNKDTAIDLAFDGYIGLIRKTDYRLEYRRDALKYISKMCEHAEETARVLPTLKAAMVLDKPQIRFQAYQMLIVLQDKNPELLKLDQLIQMGLRATDVRIKKLAIALIWTTEQLSQDEKNAKLESILRFNSDVSAELAFELLYAVAGRPSAWDDADAQKKKAEKDALEGKEKTIASLQAQIKEEKTHFSDFETAARKQIEYVKDEDVRTQTEESIIARRDSSNKTVQALQEQINAANEKFVADVKESDEAHVAAMKAPLTEADQESWAKANARRDILLQIAIDGYYAELRMRAINDGLKELARRRPYFEQSKEEFSGYFVRLYNVMKTGLSSEYSDLRRHTALEMAEYRFDAGYQVILDIFASHDSSDQNIAINALLKLGPVGWMKCMGEGGESLPRTGIILLERLAQDEFGTVQRNAIFNALGRLKDAHSSIVDVLFDFLQKGPDSADFGFAFQALLEITGTQHQILKSTKWADLTSSDFAKLQPYLSYELNWEYVSLETFITLYQDVYDEALLARIIDFVMTNGWFEVINSHNLLSKTQFTKGFDVHEDSTGSIVEPIDSVLRYLSLLPNKGETQSIRNTAINTMCARLQNKETWCPEAQEKSSQLIAGLLEFLDVHKKELDSTTINVACCLANNLYGALSQTIFDVLYSVATGIVHDVSLRIQAMKSLGYLGDERAILALLNIAGFDAYGEALLVESSSPQLSVRDVQKVQAAAAQGLGGMIFAQEREGVFQLVSTLARSNEYNNRRQGFEGLRFFGRSNDHALLVASVFASRLQASVNSEDSDEISFFLRLLLTMLDQVTEENHEANRAYVIQESTEKQVREYILCTLFGEGFEVDGEVFQPLNIEKSLFEIQNSHILNTCYAHVRQWIHGAGTASQDDTEGPIDFSYLTTKTQEERTRALKAEMLLFQNPTQTKFTDNITNILVEYLTVSELFELYAHAQEESFAANDQSKERYHIVYNALVHSSPAPILEAIRRLRQDYTLRLHDALADEIYTSLVLDIFKNASSELHLQLDLFVGLVQDLFMNLKTFTSKREYGDTEYGNQRLRFASILFSLLDISTALPVNSTLVGIAKEMLICIPLIEELEYANEQYLSLFAIYLGYGQVDWDFVRTQLDASPRELRTLVVEHISSQNAKEVLPTVLSWVQDDQGTLLRLVDVLKGMNDEEQAAVLSFVREAHCATNVVLLLSRLNRVSAFQSIIDSFRDKEGHIPEEKAIRSISTRATTENHKETLLVESLCRGLSMMATEKAEYYLRDLSEDVRLPYSLREIAKSAANVAYRRRVPVHIRRLSRQ